MAKINDVVKIKTKKIENYHGEEAFAQHDLEALTRMSLSCFYNETKYYGNNTNEILSLFRKVASADPEYAMKLTVYLRKEFFLRSIPAVFATELAQIVKENPRMKDVIYNVVERVDDITNILAYHNTKFATAKEVIEGSAVKTKHIKKLPNQIKKGLRMAFGKFTPYQLYKYKGERNVFKLADAIKLIKPIPKNDELSECFKKIIEGKTEIIDTWETKVSMNGNNAGVWEELIDNHSLGYMAALRNMRNIINAKVSEEHFTKYLSLITNVNAIKKSKQYPFRFYSAYKEVGNLTNSKYKGMALDALSTALEISIQNLKKLPGKTLIAIDVSASMTSRISEKSSLTAAEVAVLYGVMAGRICDDADVITFDTEVKEVFVTKNDSIITNVERIYAHGGGTNVALPFEYAVKNNKSYDRIIMLTDNQSNQLNNTRPYRSYWSSDDSDSKLSPQGALLDYFKTVNKNTKVHSVDLTGYRAVALEHQNVNYIGGYSDKLLEFILLSEESNESMLSKINEYTF